MALRDWPSGTVRGLQNLFMGQPEPPPERWVGARGTIFYGLVLIALGLALFSALVNLWPAVDRSEKVAAESTDVNLLWGAIKLTLTKSSGLVVLSMIAGAIGGYIHATTSFVGYAGNRNLKTAWVFWYGLRVLLGAALGFVIYMTLRAGLLGGGAGSAQIDPYGVAAFAGLAGMFSKEVIEKLKAVVATLFAGDSEGSERGSARVRNEEGRATSDHPGSASTPPPR